ncbi:hypothetical protein N825_26215 [Skermanella stibiiresistens SB22]|uniref:Uncharacterized protein n=2 Tax=Skermanella TaxID=204447 RepID=W9GRJ1_9PROT|nr:hypothetical protein N825_26215 [Skermanella stibiiresistens SB22]
MVSIMRVVRRPWVKASIAVVLGMLAAGCETPLSGAAPPESIAVTFRTDPVTGNTDGPFDTVTGRPVQTRIGDDGILRVVIDRATHAPLLVPEPEAKTTPNPSPSP